MPTMKPVKSKLIEAIGYDPDASEMHVHFVSGGKYVYENVSPLQHSALVGATSVGAHFGQSIRGRFSHRKVA